MLFEFHKELIRLRTRFVRSDRSPTVARIPGRPVLILEYPGTDEGDEHFTCLFNFGDRVEQLDGESLFSKTAGGSTDKVFDSSQARWLGTQVSRSGAAGHADTAGRGAKEEYSVIELPACSAAVYAWSKKEEES